MLVALAGCGSGGGPRHPLPERVRQASHAAPNFVAVLTDDQDEASLRLMPHVQRELVDRGVRFTHFYTTYPECCPSRATFLTGQYAHNHRVLSNVPPDGGFDAFDDANTLPVWLQRAGYRTAYVGKYLNGYGWSALGNSPTYVPPGWSTWAALVDHTEYQMYGYDLNVDGEVRAYGDAPSDYQTDVLSRLGERFLHGAAGPRPFFLTVAPLAPHDEGVLEDRPRAPRNPRPAPRDMGSFSGKPLPRPPSFNEGDVGDKPDFVGKHDRLDHGELADLTELYRSRLESLLAVDDMVHDLLHTLRATHELANTIFVFTSDNGFLLGQHRLVGKDVIYEESAKVPLVVRGPGFPSAVVRRQLVGNVDLAPTIAALARVTPGLTVDGTSLLPVARSASAGRQRDLLLEVLAQHVVSAVRTPRYLFAKYGTGETELYDLTRDPYELRNRARDPDYSRQRQRLSVELQRLRHCAGGDCHP
jgi:N-acetylglucosamine-6-sulfatase